MTKDVSYSYFGYETILAGLFIIAASCMIIYHTYLARHDLEVMKLARFEPKVLQMAFNNSDLDHNGTLSTTEFIQFLKEIDISLSCNDLDTALLELDVNHDLQVSWDEFYTWYVAREERESFI